MKTDQGLKIKVMQYLEIIAHLFPPMFVKLGYDLTYESIVHSKNA